MYFQKVSGGGWYTCTATLIARAILVTAGHCVYDGDPDNNGSWVGDSANFNSDGYFYPTYSDADGGTATPRFGRCRIERWSTTSGWFNGGGLDQAYDIGLALCGRLEGARLNRYNGTLPGQRLGYLSFCYSNCRQPYWFLSQFGFPGNYYDGGEMTVSQHVEVAGMPDPVGGSTTRDYIYGTGMRGGSSGGPHISNVGAISDSASNLGQYTVRNVIFAVTSWGFTNAQWKIQGASPLSGVNNDINFQRMFNQMCRVSRRTYGRNSCSLI
ncbi:serine protease [Pararhodobacter sp. CCB-MM2]|uniref:trypsin-like serine peptidase n=1 Tax=Pararhodobacter sp. CCB-MM2 TaxID=1786003 RepID=UPI00082B709C|nr:trypsin-like serine protease [Pararhodobacter sp. CCB-MM2]